jgi:polar amino acid transport system substrate-binding protein
MRWSLPGLQVSFRLVLLSLGWLCASAHAVEEITLFSYQHKPPYVIDGERQQGLYYELAEQLNAYLPQYRFVVRQIPRRRLDYLLSKDQLDGLVLGTSPDWFRDAPRHLWTEAFIDDANLLVSRSQGEVSRLSADQLGGRRLGVVSGHHYPELDGLLGKERISREAGISESANLLRLQRGWLDAAVIGKRTLDFYFQEQRGLRRQLYVAQPPLRTYQRSLLVPTGYARLLPDLNRVIGTLKQAPAWQHRLEQYRTP